MIGAVALLAIIAWTSCNTVSRHDKTRHPATTIEGITIGTNAWRDRVMTSEYCGTCHPAMYAEHAMNTHGRAFTDPEVRLATGNFDHGDCIRCHTPRPIFETGIGLNPVRRHYGLEEGNTCMTCHWQEDTDYANFVGGLECKDAFDPRVGTVEACASCHRNHGTPYQWELAPNGKDTGRDCMSCHMQLVERPVAVGGPVRRVRQHVFPGARSEEQVRKAYDYEARVDGNEVVVTIANTGTGHNFPTELKQRSLESLIIVRDPDGKEIARSRMVFRDPYKRPYGLHLPVNTQIPSGQEREHRVPLSVADGIVDCELHFKHYFPIEDHHPELARRLELERLIFTDVTPNTRPIESAPEVAVVTPENISPREAGAPLLVDFARPPIGQTEIDIPEGDSQEDITRLIELFMFPVPQANREARKRLAEIGMPAVPQLIEALGSWDNKTFKQAKKVLQAIGTPAVPAIRQALTNDSLYVRMHSRELLMLMPIPADKDQLVQEVLAGLDSKNAIDRRSACELLGYLGAFSALEQLRALLGDSDPDVVRSAALALARLQDREAIPALEAALAAANYSELRVELGYVLAWLGSRAGVPALMADLNHPDDLLRERCFEKFFAVTQLHLGYEPHAPREERLAALARLQAYWAQNGSTHLLRRPLRVDPETTELAWHLVSSMGGGAGIVPAAEDDEAVIVELTDMGQEALPSLLKGLKFPPGFAAKRASVLTTLGRLGDPRAAPFVAQALRDPVMGVAAHAAAALETCGDAECLPALMRYTDHVLSTAAAGQLPASIPTADPLLAQAARTRLLLGDPEAQQDLINLLLSDDLATRQMAIATLAAKYGGDRGFDPEAPAAERREAAARWQ